MAGLGDEDAAVLRLHAEHPDISIRQVAAGGVAVSTITHSREENIDAVLVDEHVDVKRVACGRFVNEVPPTRTDGDTTIVSVVEEVLEVKRRFFLKEEIHLSRKRTERTHTETVILRSQEAVIETFGESPGVSPHDTNQGE